MFSHIKKFSHFHFPKNPNITESSFGLNQKNSTLHDSIFPKNTLLAGFVYRITLKVYDTSSIVAKSYTQLWIENVEYPKVTLQSTPQKFNPTSRLVITAIFFSTFQNFIGLKHRKIFHQILIYKIENFQKYLQ